MRLTLRTLLAYMDDILEPGPTKELGVKVSESPAATNLIARIREVLRRRRLTAPELDGPGMGLDPNTVAEYLDNTLSPDSVADVERVCLESDVHLAEVAASHQILTLVLGEPIDVVPRSRERMYALGPVGGGSPRIGAIATPAATKSGNGTAAPAAAPTSQKGSAAAASSSGSFADSIPDYLRPRPLWKRLLPYAVVATMIALFVGLLATDPAFNLFTVTEPAPVEIADGDPETPPAAPVVPAPATTDEEPDVQIAAVDPATPVNPAAPVDMALDPPPPPDEPATAPAVVDNNPPVPVQLPADVPAGAEKPAAPPNEVAVNAPQPQPPANLNDPGVKPAPAAPAAPVAPAGPPVEYASADGILLRQDATDGAWYVLPRRSLLHAGELFASPEPYDSVLNVGRGQYTATFRGGSSGRLLPPTEALPAGFEIHRGRVLLQRKPVEGNDASVPVTIAVRGTPWVIQLASPDAMCGIEIVPRQPVEMEQDLGPDSYTGALYVVSGKVIFSDAPDRVLEINGKDWLPLAPAERAAALDGSHPTPPLLTQPQWLNSVEKSAIARRAAVLFEKEFESDQPVSFSIPPLVKDPTPQMSELAVNCLALTGDYRALVRALAQGPHEETRIAAITGLRNWLPLDPENGQRLREELGNVFHADDVIPVYRLLWGFGESDARDPGTSAQLVDWLEHDHIAVRELAAYHIVRLTNRRYDYRATLAPAQRKLSINRWRMHLQKEGALLPPLPPPAEPE